MKIQRRLFAAVVAATSLAACASRDVTVTHSAMPAQVLARHRTYHLVVTPAPQASRTHWMIEAALHEDLRSKGYVPVDRGSADLVVTYHTNIAEGGDKGVRQAIDGSIAARPTTTKHLAVMVHDARSNQALWRADARGTVKAGRLTSSVESALEEILAAVPYRSGGPAQLR